MEWSCSTAIPNKTKKKTKHNEQKRIHFSMNFQTKSEEKGKRERIQIRSFVSCGKVQSRKVLQRKKRQGKKLTKKICYLFNCRINYNTRTEAKRFPSSLQNINWIYTLYSQQQHVHFFTQQKLKCLFLAAQSFLSASTNCFLVLK